MSDPDAPTVDVLERQLGELQEHLNIEIALFLVEVHLTPEAPPTFGQLTARLRRILEAV